MHRPHRCKHCGIRLGNEEAASARAASSHFDRTPSFPPARGDGGEEPENTDGPLDLSPHEPCLLGVSRCSTVYWAIIWGNPPDKPLCAALCGWPLACSSADRLPCRRSAWLPPLRWPRPLCERPSQKDCAALLLACSSWVAGHIRCQRRSRAADSPGAEGGGRGQRRRNLWWSVAPSTGSLFALPSPC